MPKKLTKHQEKAITNGFIQKYSNRVIAQSLGVSDATISRRRKAFEETMTSVETITEAPKDPITSFAEAQETYNEAVYSFINTMVDSKVAEVKRENEELKQVIEAAREGNLVTNLRRHFGIPTPNLE